MKKEGKTLKDLLYERPLAEPEAVNMMICLCRELEQCEKTQTVYEDIRPEHILVSADGTAEFCNCCSGLWETGGMEASLYLAPELFHGQECDQRAAIYSLGLVFYRILNRGREPFVPLEKQIVGKKDRQEAWERRMAGERLLPPADVSAALGQILQKACDYAPGQRYQSAAGFRRALERLQRKEESRVHRWIGSRSWKQKGVAVVCLLVLLAGAAGLLWYQTPYLEHEDGTEGTFWSLSRNGVLTLDGDAAYASFQETPDWEGLSRKVQKLIIRGNAKTLMSCFTGPFVSLERVEFSEGVETVGGFCFNGVESLKQVSFPSTLKEIGMNAFAACVSLEQVTLPKGLETISDMAFGYCSSLTQVEIPDTVSHMGKRVFYETPWQVEQEKISDFQIVNGMLISYSGDEKDLVISEDLGIREISDGAFLEQKDLRSVMIADSVEKIGTQSFSDCTSLVSVTLPKGLKEVPEQAFSGCLALEKIVIPEGTEKIGRYAFRGDESLKEISIPDSVTVIEEEAFEGTLWFQNLIDGKDYAVWNGFLLECLLDEEELVIPEELEIRRIADYAISWKQKLKKVVLPEEVVSLGEGVFFMCQELEIIEFPQSLKEFGRGAMAGTKWMTQRQQEGTPVLVNGVDVSY